MTPSNRTLAVLALSSLALGFGTVHASQTGTQAPARTAPAAASGNNIVETAVAAGEFTTLAKLLSAADLISALEGPGPFTVFAPTDATFAKLPSELVADLLKPENKARLQAILKYHVVPAKAMAKDLSGMTFAKTLQGQRIDLAVRNGSVKVDGATVVKADIEASNGVIHVIDAVILPMEGNILEVARGAGTFGTLLAAIEAAGMAELFRGPGPFTVLAPTDQAFQSLPKGTLEDLLKPENRGKLAEVLAFHVIPGIAAYSDDVVKLSEVQTAGGRTAPVAVADGTVRIGGAKVVKADIEASNGVIHVLDTVLIPAAKSTAGAETSR
jgi:uncharacterized surface protein with fasciclin (FAS1) repeats